VEFCSEYDALLASEGPPAVFLLDRRGRWRVHHEWTRDAWVQHPGTHDKEWRWCLWRDHTTGYVMLLMVTSSTLLTSHPHGDVRPFLSIEEAKTARAQFGEPPVCRESW
jgi:hypothetical protein